MYYYRTMYIYIYTTKNLASYSIQWLGGSDSERLGYSYSPYTPRSMGSRLELLRISHHLVAVYLWRLSLEAMSKGGLCQN